MTEPAGFGTVALLLERVLTELQGLRADLAASRRDPPSPVSAAEPEGLWPAERVAAFLGCSKSWVYDAAAAGRIPSLHVAGMLRFQPEAIRRLARGERTGAKVLPLRSESKCNTTKA